MENKNFDENDVLNSIEIEPTSKEDTNDTFLSEEKNEVNNIEKKENSNDILINEEKIEVNEVIIEENQAKNESSPLIEEKIESKNTSKEVTKKVNSKMRKGLLAFGFILKYILTSIFIFGFLLLSTNYSAYTTIVKNYVYKEEVIKTQQSLINSVNASVIKEKIQKKEDNKKMYKNLKDVQREKDEYKTSIYSMSQLMNKANREDININIDISPYENRIVIPKIGENIPLVDIKRKLVSGKNELNEIFMDELKNGVIRYPGSVKPGEIGNTFVFGHSSNFPWISGDYNEVFALLDKIQFEDEIIVYYGQEKFTYKVREKKVIRPGNVGVLKSEKGKKEITLMTCWPVGTTLNRLIVVGELIENK